MITIDVKVYGGVAPVPLNVTISEQYGKYNETFSRDESFTESFDLPIGVYDIVISGENPYNPNNDDEIRTEITVSGETNTGSIHLKKIKTVEEYTAGFSFSI